MPKILIADDIAANRKLLSAMLRAEEPDFELSEVENGQEVLDAVANDMPDLILLDVMMPQMNGFEVCDRLKGDQKTRFIPIIMVTALTNFKDRIKGIEAGTDDFLSKPVRREELLTRVRSLLRMREMHVQLEESHRIVQEQKAEIEKKNELLSDILNRYVSEEVTTQILKDPDKFLKLGGESRKITTLFADIRGFTAFSNQRTATEVVSTLNTVFDCLTKIVFDNRGTFDKFLGDGMMVFYGAPISYPDDAFRAVQTAVAMQCAFQEVQQTLDDTIFSDLGLGIGINTGDAIVGNVGSERTMDYTVIADSVNIASRLVGIAQKGEIIISEHTYAETSNRIIADQMAPQKIKGIQNELMLYRLVQVLD